MRYFWGILLMICFVFQSKANIGLTNDFDGKIDVAPFLQYYCDTSKSLTPNQVKNKDFELVGKKVPSFGLSPDVYWLQFNVENLSNETDQFLLEIKYATLNNVQCFLEYDDGNIVKHKAGLDYPASEIELVYRHPLFRLPLQKKQSVKVYIRIETISVKICPVFIYDKYRFFQTDRAERNYSYLLFGILIATIVFNIILGLLSKKISFAYLNIAIVFITIYFYFLLGFGNETFAGLSPYIKLNIRFWALTLNSLFHFIFAISYLNLKKHKFFYRLFLSIPLTLIGIQLLCIINQDLLYFYNNVITYGYILNIFFQAIVCFYLWRKGSSSAKYFLISLSVLVSLSLFYNLALAGIVPFFTLTIYSPLLGSTAFVLLLTIGLSEKFTQVRAEQEKNLQLQKDKQQLIDEIKERWKIEKSLLDSEKKFKNLFELSPQPIAVTSLKNGRIIEANAGMQDYFGIELENAVGKTTVELGFISKDDRIAFKRELDDKGIVDGLEVNLRNKKGEIIPSLMYASIVKIEDELRTLTLISDISKIKKTEKELVNAKTNAEKANQAKSMFLANMSHEIRTPLNAVIGFAELLSSRIEDPSLQGYASSIKTSGNTLLRLINDILDLSKIEAGKIQINYEPVDIRKILTEVKDIFIEKIEDKGLVFQMHIDEKTPKGIIMDELRFRQIVFNLLGNAVKFTKKGLISVRLNILAIRENDFDFEFKVKDTGVGIDTIHQKDIFEAFEQTNKADIQKYSGTGLGLAISKRLTEMMNGRISLESIPSKGSSFNLEFKNIKYTSEITENNKPSFPKIKPQKVEGKIKILIADDNDGNIELIKSMLLNDRIVFYTASDGKEAVEAAKNHKPDIILMDLRMPEMSGHEALLEIRKTDKETPIIAISATGTERTNADFAKMGFNSFIQKPVLRNKLRQLMVDLFPQLSKVYVATKKTHKWTQPRIIDTKKYLETISIIEREIMPIWEEVKDSAMISDIENFGNELKKLAEENNIPKLKSYSEKLFQSATDFEISTMKNLLQTFPKLVDSLKSIANTHGK